MNKIITTIMLAGTALLPLTSEAVISINFSSDRTDIFFDELQSSDVAGVVSASNWNNTANGRMGSMSGLVDDTGATTTLSLSYSSYETWRQSQGIPHNNSETAPVDADHTLMFAGLATADTDIHITADLADIPYEYYDIYVYTGSAMWYTGGNSNVDVSLNSGEEMRYLLGDVFDDTNYTLSDSTVIGSYEQGNYVRFRDVSGDSASLDIGFVSPENGGIVLHGIQVVAVPEPATTAAGLMGCILLVTLLWRRRG